MEELKSVRAENYLQQFNLMYFKHKNDTTKLIITSPKCGTRYLSGTAESNAGFSRFHPGELTKAEIDNYFSNVSEIYWIIRPPMEHLISAIMTEHQSNMNSVENPNKTSSKLKIKKNDEEWKLTILETLLKDILTEPKFTINTNNNGSSRFGHYTPKYNTIYNDIPYKIEFFSKIKFVELKNLSQLLESEFNIYFNIEDKNYAMNQYFTKSSILAAMELNFADMWSELKKIIDTEQYYYTSILNYDYEVLFTTKINEAHKELDSVYDKLKKLIPSYSSYRVKNIKNNITNIKKQLKIN